MKLIDQITIKADCVEFFLRDMAKQYCDPTYIVDVIMKPQDYQEVFDKWRIKEGYDEKPVFTQFVEEVFTPNPMDRPNKIGKVKDSFENEECTHENIEYQPAEYDTNVQEAYTCADCGIDLEPEEEGR